MTAAPPDPRSHRAHHPARGRTAAIPTLVMVTAVVIIVALILML
jgi:hypothetical protein